MKTADLQGVMEARTFFPKNDGELNNGFPLNRILEKGDTIS